jgi:ClpX C4-type zinc finger protein
MERTAPPPVLDSARVLAYAFVDDISYRQWGALYAGDKLIEQVPRLAIGVNLGKDIGPMLFHCDEFWEVLGTTGAETVQAIKDRAEKNYPGVMSRWIEVNTSVAEAITYYDSQSNGLKCSFCGKRSFEITGLVEAERAAICRGCVEDYYRAFHEGVSGE